MKICVIHRYPMSVVRETNPSFSLFIDKLSSISDKVFFVCFKEIDNRYKQKEVFYRELNFKINRSQPIDKLLKSLFFIFLVPFKVRRLHREVHLDLIYCDDSFPFYGYFIKVIAKSRTVIRLGDLQTAYMFADRGKVGKFLFKVLFSLEKYMWMRVDKVIVISDAFKRFLMNNGIPEMKIGIVPECVDLEMFRPMRPTGAIRRLYGISVETPLIMFHGVIAQCKGLSTLLYAIPLILKKVPNAEFMIIGIGPVFKRLKRLAQKLRIESSVIFTGWIPFKNIPEYINEANIGIPMRSGNLGNHFVVTTGLLQYCAMKKPIVVPRLSAIENLFAENSELLLFMPDNEKDLAEKIIHILQDPEKAEKIGNHGRIIAKQNFNINLIAQKMLDFLILDQQNKVTHIK